MRGCIPTCASSFPFPFLFNTPPMPKKSTWRITRRRDEQCCKNYTAHLWQDIQGSPTPGTLLVNTMKDHDYKTSSNNTYVDVPTVKNQRPTSHERRPPSNNSMSTLKRAPFNTYQWISS